MAKTNVNGRMITINGKSKTISEWSNILGLSTSCLHQQIKRHGEDVISFYLTRNPGEKVGKINKNGISPKNNPTVIYNALQRGAFVDPVHLFRTDLIGFNKYSSGTMAK